MNEKFNLRDNAAEQAAPCLTRQHPVELSSAVNSRLFVLRVGRVRPSWL